MYLITSSYKWFGNKPEYIWNQTSKHKSWIIYMILNKCYLLCLFDEISYYAFPATSNCNRCLCSRQSCSKTWTCGSIASVSNEQSVHQTVNCKYMGHVLENIPRHEVLYDVRLVKKKQFGGWNPLLYHHSPCTAFDERDSQLEQKNDTGWKGECNKNK